MFPESKPSYLCDRAGLYFRGGSRFRFHGGVALNLLVVDDNIDQFRLVRTLLKELKLPHVCHYAQDGVQALDFLNRRPPFEAAPRADLILLDLDMPRMNGCEVLHQIKGDPSLRSIPAIILSGSGAPGDVNACYREHANAFVEKPMDLDETIRVLQSIDRFWSLALSAN
jgi:two-component system, chemotaxis family, response regulator Rcp1